MPNVDLYTVTPDPQPGEDPSFPRTFRIGFPTQQLSGTYVVTLKPNIFSKAGDAIDTNLNAGVDLLTGKATSGQTTPISYNSTNTPLAIPDVSSISSQITVTDEDRDFIKHTSSRLSVGSVLSREDMLHIALMASENRAAAALSREAGLRRIS